MSVVNTDVLIVGAGPAGLTASALLARQGVSAMTLCKYPSTADGPRAHITNQRTLEIMRDLGIESDVYDTGQKMEEVPDLIWTTSLAGRELSRRRAWGTRVDRKADYDAASPCLMTNIGQHVLEPIILDRARELGADVRFNNELIDIAQDADGVTATVRNRLTEDTHEIRAQYVVGADGGRSTVAQQGGFQIDGEAKLGYAINVYIEADLAHLVAHRPATLYWTNYPGREYFFGSGTFTLVRRWDEWTVQFSYDPQAEFLEATEEMLLPRVQEGIGDPDVPVKIKRIGKWELNRLVAREYRRGRLFLAGDAAHRHPPANGLGSNTSIQDSFNLAWKLAAVLSGVADDALLDSYDAERRPVGHQIVERAVASVGLVAALSPKWGIRSGQPEHEGWAELEALFEAKPESSLRREELAEALDGWDYGINAHGVEMGQQYSSKAVIDDGTPDTPPQRDPELYYHATTRPGAHLPHVWLVHEGSLVSSLDLVPSDGWALITGVGGDDWVEAAGKLSAQSGISIATRVVGLGAEYNDSYGEWAKVREISDSGALLIRPDRHIGWRATDLVTDATSVLSQALDAILHPTV